MKDDKLDNRAMRWRKVDHMVDLQIEVSRLRGELADALDLAQRFQANFDVMADAFAAQRNINKSLKREVYLLIQALNAKPPHGEGSDA